MDKMLLSFITLSPLLGILILAFIPKDRGRTIKGVGMIIPLLPLLASIYLFAKFDLLESGNQYAEKVHWLSLKIPFAGLAGREWADIPINYELAVDGFSMPLVVMTAIIGLLAAMAAQHIRLRLKEFFVLFFILMTGMFGVFMAQNLILFFLFFELTLIPTFFLIGIWGYHDREKAANSFLIYNGVGSAIMLIAFIALFVKTGSFDIAEIHSRLSQLASGGALSNTFLWGTFIALLIAFGIKLPIFPFHTWMLKVHVQAPPAIVMIHSGVLLKMGAYGLLRFGYGFFPDLVQKWATVLALLGLINILYGAILAFVQRDLKMVLAYSSISHMGIVLFGIAALNGEGFQGAIFQMISHGFISALMFFIIGVIYERTQTSFIDEMGGLARSMPFVSGILLTAAMASLGLPLMSGFISELQAFLGLFKTDVKWIAVIGTLGLILTAVYLLRAVLRTTFGPTPEAWQGLTDAKPMEVIPMIVLLGFIVLIGVYPAVLSDPLQTTITDLLSRIGG
jgi:NADH-quinone oxidoreductase subunit M